jgi:predicted RNA-binding protein with RPS1 domain
LYKSATKFLQRRRERGFLPRDAELSQTEAPAHLRGAFRTGQFVCGKIHERVKTGFTVRFGKFEAFCPASEMYPRLQEGNDEATPLPRGLQEFAILRIGIRDVVVSRLRAARANALREAHFALRHGLLIEGTVERIMPYGAFIDLGGVTGLLHISQALVDSAGDLSAYCFPGDQLQVFVVSIDRAQQRLSLSLPTPLDARPSGKQCRPVKRPLKASAGGSDGRSARAMPTKPPSRRIPAPQPAKQPKKPKGNVLQGSNAWEKTWRGEWIADPNAVPHKVKSVRGVQGGLPDSNRRRH